MSVHLQFSVVHVACSSEVYRRPIVRHVLSSHIGEWYLQHDVIRDRDELQQFSNQHGEVLLREWVTLGDEGEGRQAHEELKECGVDTVEEIKQE